MIGFYNYDNTLFDELTFPEGIDKSLAVDTILTRSGEFETLYSTFESNKALIGVWGRKHYRTFDKWLKALNAEYDPLANYDRKEDYTDTETVNNTGAVVSSETGSQNETRGTQATQKVVTDQDATDTQKVAAYDAATSQLKEENITANDSTVDTTDISTVQVTGSDSRNGNTQSNNNTARSFEHHARMFGNIGVTSSQQLLQSELDVQRFNIFDQIADLFIDEFCILVY